MLPRSRGLLAIWIRERVMTSPTLTLINSLKALRDRDQLVFYKGSKGLMILMKAWNQKALV